MITTKPRNKKLRKYKKSTKSTSNSNNTYDNSTSTSNFQSQWDKWSRYDEPCTSTVALRGLTGPQGPTGPAGPAGSSFAVQTSFSAVASSTSITGNQQIVFFNTDNLPFYGDSAFNGLTGTYTVPITGKYSIKIIANIIIIQVSEEGHPQFVVMVNSSETLSALLTYNASTDNSVRVLQTSVVIAGDLLLNSGDVVRLFFTTNGTALKNDIKLYKFYVINLFFFISSVIFVLYLRKPLIFATNIFIIAIISFTNSSSGVCSSS